MAIRFQCETCNRPINVKREMAGHRGICPHCNREVPIPHESRMTDDAWRSARVSWFSDHPSASSSNSRLSGIGGAVTAGSAATSVQVNSQSAAKFLSQNFGPVATDSNPIPKPLVGPADMPQDPFAESPDAMWYVRPSSGGQFGPASANLFRQWMGEGRVSGDSWIWRQGWEDWQPAFRLFPNLAVTPDSAGINSSSVPPSTTSRTRAAYMKARKRRTIWTSIGLIVGTLIVGGLIFLLAFIVRTQGGF
jgi:hypothetical protein